MLPYLAHDNWMQKYNNRRNIYDLSGLIVDDNHHLYTKSDNKIKTPPAAIIIYEMNCSFFNIPLALLLGTYWGVKGVIISLIISTFANTIWPKIQIKNIFLGKRSIWVK